MGAIGGGRPIFVTKAATRPRPGREPGSAKPGQKNKGPPSRGKPTAEAEAIQWPPSGDQRAAYAHEREAELNNDMIISGARGISLE